MISVTSLNEDKGNYIVFSSLCDIEQFSHPVVLGGSDKKHEIYAAALKGHLYINNLTGYATEATLMYQLTFWV